MRTLNLISYNLSCTQTAELELKAPTNPPAGGKTLCERQIWVFRGRMDSGDVPVMELKTLQTPTISVDGTCPVGFTGLLHLPGSCQQSFPGSNDPQAATITQNQRRFKALRSRRRWSLAKLQ